MAEQIPGPTYHYPPHLETYDVITTRLHGGYVEKLIGLCEDLLYPGNQTVIGAHTYTSNSSTSMGYFSETFHLVDAESLGWQFENLVINAEHTKFIGNTALKQAYKIQVQNEIYRGAGIDNRVTSIYYLEQYSGTGQAFFGTITRPNILQNETAIEEDMTVYDCLQFETEITRILHLAAVDARSQAAV